MKNGEWRFILLSRSDARNIIDVKSINIKAKFKNGTETEAFPIKIRGK